MQHLRNVLLAFSLLTGCAAAEPSAPDAIVPPAGARQSTPDPQFGEYLAGRFAASQSDIEEAAKDLLLAYAANPDDDELLTQTFLACLMAGRPDALRLAQKLPDNPAAQLLLGTDAALIGNWDGAEARFASLPNQGLTQLLQPVLVAWTEFGANHVNAALSTLAPFIQGPRFRGVYALHAALIADLGGRKDDAGRLYQIAQAEYGGLTMRLALVLASWQSRQGQGAEALKTLDAMANGNAELTAALPEFAKSISARPVANATDGIAEAYLALAAALRQQNASEYAMLLLQLAIDARPDFTAARLLMSDTLQSLKHPKNALQVLAPVPDSDALASVVQLRRAGLLEDVGRTDDAMRLLDQIAHAEPNRPEPLARLGDLLRGKSRFTEAVAAYDGAISRIPHPGSSDWPLFYDRGVALERAKQWPRAEADFMTALQLAPDQPFVLNYLGYSWTEQGRNLSKARQMIERALQQRPNDGSIVDSLGWLILRQGNAADAVKQLEHAVELQPEDATINGHLGDAYWAVGRKREAQFQWERALTLNPEPDEISGLQAKLHEAQSGGVVSTSIGQRSLQ
jgi:tetratricopeptide (TPR) repeat protein